MKLGPAGSEQARTGRSLPPPEGFLEFRGPRLLLWVRKGFSFLLEDGGRLRSDRAFCAEDRSASYAGRGRLQRLSLGPMGDSCALVRHYHRGGVFRNVLRDCYLGRRRFLQEVRVSEWARRQGVPTAEVLALRSERRRLCFYQADLVTREIGGSEDLDRYLKSLRVRGEQAGRRRKDVRRSVALLLQRMHRAGLYHADLNLKNILVQFGESGVKSYVIDLDRARVIQPLRSRMRIRNLLRLYRSLEKQGYLQDPVGTREILAFVRDYCGEDRELLAACRDVMRKDLWLLRTHRMGWRLSRGWRKAGRGRDG